MHHLIRARTVFRYQQLLLQYTSLVVTPSSDEWTQVLNQMCPCGGTWATGTARVLTSCGQGMGGSRPCESLFVAQVFPGGSLNTGGFGTIQLNANQLRISPASTSSVNGPNMVMTGLTTILNKAPGGACDTNSSASLCGNWTLPCHVIPNTSYATTGILTATGRNGISSGVVCDECFWMSTTVYQGQTGCEAGSTSAYLTIEQNGHYGVMGPSDQNRVRNGNNVQFTSQMFAVTPLSQQAATDLNVLCQCGGQWALNTARQINGSCPANNDGSPCTVDGIRQGFGASTQSAVPCPTAALCM